MLGGSWRVPTLVQMQELINNCDSIWTTINGMSGRLYTSRINGATIFFPAAGIYSGDSVSGVNTTGRYWTSKIGEGTNAERFGIGESDAGSVAYNNRWFGFTIRPVKPGTPNRSIVLPTTENEPKEEETPTTEEPKDDNQR